MRIRIRPRIGREPPSKKPLGYPVRPSSFAASAAAHCIAIVFLGLMSANGGPPERPVYGQLIEPQVHKIVFYDLRKKLPEVKPLKRIGRSPRPRGTEISKQVVIATSPKAKSKEQFIWLPVPKVEIRQDLRVPDLIARIAGSLPSLPAPPEERVQQKKTDGTRAAQHNSSPPQLKGDVNHAPESAGATVPTHKQPRAFIPPPQTVSQPRLPIPVPVVEMPAPSIASPTTMDFSLPVGPGMPVLSKSSLPVPGAPTAPAPVAGSADVDIAIASLHPAQDASSELPEGERSGRFSKAPTKGNVATGELGGSRALTVPDLSIREDKTKSVKVPEERPPSRTVLYAEKVRNVPLSTLSVPLRPASRTIPASVDIRFQGRNVYTMVMPIENLPEYAGDWIIWFAEREPKPGNTPLMRAPVPFRKYEPVEQAVSGNRTGQRVQITAILSKNGRLESVSLLTMAGSAVQDAVIRDVMSWEFKPATRNGMPVDVEVVIEIPFNLPPAIAKRAQP